MLAHRVRRVALVVLPLCLILTDISAIEPFRVLGQTNAPGLRVRTEANLESPTLGSLPEGARIEIIDVTAEPMDIGEHRARWYRIQPLPGGTEPAGWSYGAFIDVASADRLALAIWTGRVELVREILRGGLDPNSPLVEDGLVFTEYEEYEYRSAPIVEAVRAGRPDIVRVLLEAGADPDLGYVHGEPGGTARGTALMAAVESGDPAIARLLLQAGADPEHVESMFGGGGDRFEVTALSHAVTAGNLEMVRLLLDSRADPNHLLVYRSILQDSRTLKSALDIAVETRAGSIAELIRSYGGEPAPE
jgi:ankyrin repeat protein